MIRALKDLGYQIEYDYLVPSDKDAKEAIELNKRFSDYTRIAIIKILESMPIEDSETKIINMMEVANSVILQAFLKFYGHLIPIEELE